MKILEPLKNVCFSKDALSHDLFDIFHDINTNFSMDMSKLSYESSHVKVSF